MENHQLTLCPFTRDGKRQIECKIYAPRRLSCICAYHQDDGQCNMSYENPKPDFDTAKISRVIEEKMIEASKAVQEAVIDILTKDIKEAKND